MAFWQNGATIPQAGCLSIPQQGCLAGCSPPWVSSISSSLTVYCSTVALTGVDSQQKIRLPRISCSFNDSCSSPLFLSLHQPLLPPHKVSPVKVKNLRVEVPTHPDKPFVTYVLDGLQNGFLVGFNPALVSIKSATQNMPSGSLQPSVIDNYVAVALLVPCRSSVTSPSHQPFWSHPRKKPARPLVLDSGFF